MGMGEPTCLMQQQPFSYGIPNEANQGNNPLHALGQSISFGKFISESLAWEKWSTFSHNRYVEEAERFARPGFVAQKKAFFEAHYKNLAARKAAALLEQANAAASNVPESAQEDEVEGNATQNPGIIINTEASFLPDDNGHTSHDDMEKSESINVEAVDPVRENQVYMKNFVKVDSLSQLGVSDNEEDMKETELRRTKPTEKPMLKDVISNRDDLGSRNNNKPAIHSSKSLISGKASKLPCTPAKTAASVPVGKENNAPPISKKSSTDFMDGKKSTPKSTDKPMNLTPVREINRITSTIIKKIDGSKVTSNSKALKDCPTHLRTPTTVPKHSLATPISERKRFEGLSNMIKNTRKFKFSDIFLSGYTCMTCTNCRAETPLHPSASGSKTVRHKWHILTIDCSKFMSACRTKSPCPNLSTPFSLTTEERAARRKERLEEKFNANQAQKVHLQATLKEKAEAELKRLRRTLCFKARPLP